MKKNFLAKMIFAMLLGFFGLTKANAQFLTNAKTVDIVEVGSFDGNGETRRYLADIDGVVTFSLTQDNNAKWYAIPAGAVSNGTEDVQAYYYKNVATKNYLCIDDATLAQLANDRGGDWPMGPAKAVAVNAQTLGFKWFYRPGGPNGGADWGWSMWFSNAAGIDLTARQGNDIYTLMSITMMNGASGGGFGGVNYPDVAVGGFAGGYPGNAWSAVQKPAVTSAGVANPDYLPENPPTVNIVEVGSFDGNGEARRYLADIDGVVTFSLTQDNNAKWYAIPAGAVSNGTADVQAYYYKNVATKNYLCIDDAGLAKLANDRPGDWPMVAAKAVAVNAKTDGFKWFYRPGNDWPWATWFSNAADIDLTARPGDDIYTLMSITMMNGASGGGFGGVNYPDVAVGGFAGGYPGNAWSAVQTPAVTSAGVVNPDYDVAQTCLDLSNLTLLGDGASYDATTQTITYTGAWQYAGWQWDGGTDFSAYNYLDVTFSTEGITGASDVEFCVSYVDGWSGDGDYITHPAVKAGMQTVRIPIGVGNRGNVGTVDSPQSGDVPMYPADATKVWRIGTKNSGSGTIVLESLCFGYQEKLAYSTDKLNFFASDSGEDANAASYDAATKTITYNDTWRRAGWNFAPDGGLDCTGYDKVCLTFDASALPDGADGGPGHAKLQFDVTYMDGSKATVGGSPNEPGSNEYRANDTLVWWSLDPGKKISLITLKSEVKGDVVLKDAYLYTNPVNPVDLIITKLWWDPETPAPGDSVTFFVNVKNDSEFDSPANVKHGVAFSVDGSVKSWSDAFHGPLAAGEEIELSSTMEGSTGALWACGANPSYTISAQVNDTKDVKETDYDNNTKVETMTVNGMADLVVTGITWTPVTPVKDSKVVFALQVKNQGNVNVPSTVITKAKFYVDGTWVTTANYTQAIAADTTVTVSIEANADTTGLSTHTGVRYNYWTPPFDNTKYTIRGEVNGDESIAESDYTNNTAETTLTIGTLSMGKVSVSDGNVYVNNGALYMVNYPVSSVAIYSLLGQKVASFDAVSDKVDVNLASGIYIVTVQFDGKIATQKVIVK